MESVGCGRKYTFWYITFRFVKKDDCGMQKKTPYDR